MAKEKNVAISDLKNRDLGKVKKLLPSGMYLTSEDEKIAPYVGIEIGDVVNLVNGNVVPPNKKVEPLGADPLAKENEALKARLEKLEALIGEKGSDVKTGAAE